MAALRQSRPFFYPLSEGNGGLEAGLAGRGDGCVGYFRRTFPPTEASAPPRWRAVGAAEFGANQETTR